VTSCQQLFLLFFGNFINITYLCAHSNLTTHYYILVVSGFIENENSECSMGTSMLLHQYQGSTCQIYSFYDQGKRLLVKRLRAEYLKDARMVEIFHKEYETGRRISSPYLVEYISMGEDEKGPFIVMEFVDGETLADALISRKDWFASADNLLRFVSQLLECLQTLHNHQILHLDLKPDNILLTRVSSDVKVIDLGYCYSDTYFASAGKNNLFSAPEQLNGTNTFDVRTDLYAVGKMLEYICSLSEIKISKPLQQVIEKSTQAVADQRYASAEEMCVAVSEALKPKPSYVLRAAVLLAVFCCSLALYVFTRTQQNRQVDLDEYRYTLLSDDSLTCSVDQYICNWPIPSRPLTTC